MKIKEVLFLISLLLLITFTGVMGYHFIEGWSFSDSLYMTIITLTTTGFQEVKKLSELGRAFTMVLLVGGVGLVAYCATSVMQQILTIDLSDRRRKKMEANIKKLKEHTIICGFGRMGRIICKELHEHKIPFVVIDKNKDNIENLSRTPYLWLGSDASNDDTLLMAGIVRAKTLISMIDNDADALYLTLASRNLNKKLQIIARANEENAEKKLYLAGADKVVLPFIMTGQKVAESIVNPAVEDFLNISGVKGKKGHLQLADIIVDEHSHLKGRTLQDCGVKKQELIIVGIKKPDSSFIFAPKGDYVFALGDCVIVLGTKENYEKVMKGIFD